MARKVSEKTSLVEKAETAIVEKPKEETGIVKKEKGETAVVKKEKAETAVVKKTKAETAVVKKEKQETAVAKTEKKSTAVVKKEKAAAAKPAAKKNAAKKDDKADGEKKAPARSKKKTVPTIARDELVYIDIVNYVRDRLKTADAGVISGKMAYQIDITGPGSGIFYIEIVEGFLAVEPYDYHDRDARFAISSDDLLDMMEGRLEFDTALAEGRLYIEGNWDRAMEMKKLLAQIF